VPEATWTKIDVRDGENGIIEMEIVKCRVQARTDGRRVGPEETLVVTHTRDEEGNLKHDYYLSNAPYETELQEFARVATAAHRIEECIKRGKSEAGMADYEVRTWHGWYHHQVITMLAIWFLILETGPGQKKRRRSPCLSFEQVLRSSFTRRYKKTVTSKLHVNEHVDSSGINSLVFTTGNDVTHLLHST
jgi:hypothetical protein